MKTLEQVKKDKNYLAYSKDYPIDPEGFSLKFLLKRLADEHRELLEIIRICTVPEGEEITLRILSTPKIKDEIIEELADMSNLIDYIATKLIVDYPTKYNPEERRG